MRRGWRRPPQSISVIAVLWFFFGAAVVSNIAESSYWVITVAVCWIIGAGLLLLQEWARRGALAVIAGLLALSVISSVHVLSISRVNQHPKVQETVAGRLMFVLAIGGLFGPQAWFLVRRRSAFQK